MHLQGSLPTELGLLERVATLTMPNNHLNDSIPSHLGNIQGLRDLNLEGNQHLSGSVPMELWTSLKMLRKMLVGGNRLKGKFQAKSVLKTT